jgi:iron(III) transport system ATP-binding protein
MLNVRDASKTFLTRGLRVQALCAADLDVKNGHWTAVLGPSGSGKTTLLRSIAGFEQLDAGTIELDGRLLAGPGRHVVPERRGIGILAQDGALFPHLDVAANVGFGLVRGATRWSFGERRARARRVAELLDMVGLAGFQRRRVHELSGGQQQRVALARALAPAPQVVLLDEPFSALDASLRTRLREEVRGLLREMGITVVLVTHDQEEALSLADHVVVMREGSVVQAGPPSAVYAAPSDPATASFLGEAVLLTGRIAAGSTAACAAVDCPLGRIPVRDPAALVDCRDEDCLVMLRPEQLQISQTGMPARVVGGSFFGHDAVIRARLGAAGTGPLVLARTMRDELPAVDDVIHLSVDGDAAAYPPVA